MRTELLTVGSQAVVCRTFNTNLCLPVEKKEAGVCRVKSRAVKWAWPPCGNSGYSLFLIHPDQADTYRPVYHPLSFTENELSEKKVPRVGVGGCWFILCGRCLLEY